MPSIPNKFIQDVSSKDTNIFVKVVIHTEEELNHNLYYSTNKLTFQGVGMDSNKQVYWQPLLLKIPSVKEKYDIDTKKVVVSKLTLTFSNAHIEGSRMSDTLAEIGLVEKNVTVYYQTQSAKTNNDCLIVFNGLIKRVKHDSKTLNLELHDLGSGLHKDLPQTYLDDLVGEASQGRPVPINYGWQEYAPTVIQKSGSHYKVWFDTCVVKAGYTGYHFETSGKTTETTSWMGFANKTGWCNPYSRPPYIGLYSNGQYGRLYENTFGKRYNYDTMGELENNLTATESDAIQPHQNQFNVISGYQGAEPWDRQTESYFKLYKTRLLRNQNCLGVVFNKKTDSVKFSVVKQPAGVAYPDELEEYDGPGANELTERATDGSYWGTSGWGHFAWNIGAIPDFTTSNADGSDIPDNMRQWPTGPSSFRVQTAELIIGTDPDVGEKRIQSTSVYINGLRQYTYNNANDFVEFNDEISGSTVFDNGSYLTVNEDGVGAYYNETSLGGSGSIISAPDVGHGDSEADYYPRETYAMNYYWSTTNTNPNNTGLALSKMDAGSYDFMPAFQYSCSSVNSHYTIGSVRFYAGAAVHKEYKIQWYQEFRSNDFTTAPMSTPQLGQWVTGTKLKAQLRQIDVINSVHMENPFSHPITVNIKGRVYDNYDEHKGNWSDDRFLTNPADIIRHLVEWELGFYEFDEEDYALAYEEHDSWRFTCSVKDVINSKALIEDIAQYTKMFPKFGSDGKFRFNSIKKSYSVEDYNKALSIEYSDLIDYKFELTKIEDVVSKIDLRYRWDHYNESCSKKWGDVIGFGLISNGDWNQGGPPPSGMVHAYYRGENNGGFVGKYLPEHNDAELAFYNRDILEDISKYTKKLECKYFTDLTTTSDLGANGICQGPGSGGDTYYNLFSNYTAYKVYDYYWYQHKNQHLFLKLKLPVKYVYLDVGNIVKIQELYNDLMAYGINYTKLQNINNQYRYPLFFVTSMNKSVDHVEITCMQLHYLGETSDMADADEWENIGVEPEQLSDIFPPFVPEPPPVIEDTEEEIVLIGGCTNPAALNYNPEAEVDDGTCEYPIYGCTDPNAVNYDSNADLDNGSCSYYNGCTDPAAINFTEGATVDDGSCVYDWGESYTMTFGGINNELDVPEDSPPGSMHINLNSKTFLFKDFTNDGTFGYGDFASADEAYTAFYSIALPVGQQEDGSPNEAWEFIFNINKWRRNGVAQSSWIGLLFGDAEGSTINSDMFPDESALITIKIGHQESLWNNTNKVFCDISNVNEEDLLGFMLPFYEAQMDNAGPIIYFTPWYGIYEWKLCIYWDDSYTSGYNFTLEWKLETIELATNYFSRHYADWFGDTIVAYHRGIIIGNSNDYGDYTDEMGGDIADYLGIDAWQGVVLNNYWNTDQALIDSAPILVDKASYGIIPQHGFMDIFSAFGAEGWDPGNLDFAASEVTITINESLVSIGPDEGGDYITFETFFETELTQAGTYIYSPPAGDFPLGDVNMDSNVNVLDVVTSVGIILGNNPDYNTDNMSDEHFLAADFNGDGTLNILDIVAMVNFILGND